MGFADVYNYVKTNNQLVITNTLQDFITHSWLLSVWLSN